MEIENIPEWEARRQWALLNGEELPSDDRELLLKFVEGLTYHEYLKDRGISKETALRFHVGYVGDFGDILFRLGVSSARAASIGLYDCSDSIVYPFFDKEGAYKISSRKVQEKSYKTSPETAEYYKIGLWGTHLLRGSEAWVFEGYHDAMVAYQAGYPAVAACGTSMKPEQWRELEQVGIKKVVFVPDGDKAGLQWLEALAQSAPPVSMEFVVLQSGDPDDEILRNKGLGHLRRWNPFEWWIVSKYGSPSTVSEHIRMLEDSRRVFFRMPEVDRSCARLWYRNSFSDDESLSYIQEEVRNDPSTERIVIANCIYSTPARLDAVQRLDMGCFTGKLHQKMFTMMNLEMTPQMALSESNFDFADYADIGNYSYYIDKLEKIGHQRKIQAILRQADLANPGTIIDQIYKATDKISSTDGVALVRGVVEDINQRVKNPGMPGVEIAVFPTLNKCLLGLQKEKYLLISGNSGHGKTTTLCNIVNDVVDDHSSLMFSLEMTDKEIMQKLISIRSGIPSMKLQTGSLDQQEYEKVMRSADEFIHGNLEIVSGVQELRKIQAVVKSHILRRNIRFVFLDYLQLIRLGGSRDDRWEQLIVISEGMKEIARLGVSVVALSQLSAKGLSNKVAEASDQAGSYGILAPVDYAVTVRRKNAPDKDGSNMEINVSKSRFGWDGVIIPIVFDRVTQRMAEAVGV
jgi:replicative DNA helicase